MGYLLEPFAELPLDESLLRLLIDEHEREATPRLQRLWNYYRNALADPSADGGSLGAPAQFVGLPARLTGPRRTLGDDRIQREVFIENDIAWRVHTLTDFMFPAPPQLLSKASDPELRRTIESVLGSIIDASGAEQLWQTAALLSSVYGHVDFLLRTDGLSRLPRFPNTTSQSDRAGNAPSEILSPEMLLRLRSAVTIETVEAPRVIALLNRSDYRRVDAVIVH